MGPKSSHQLGLRMRINRSPWALPVWHEMVQPQREAAQQPPKRLRIGWPCDPAIPLLGYSQRNWKQRPSQELYTHIHSSITHNGQKTHTDEWIKKTWSIRTMEYWALKRKTILTRYNFDEPRKHNATCNKPDTKGQKLHCSTYWRYLQQSSSQRQKVVESTRDWEQLEGELLFRERRISVETVKGCGDDGGEST